MYVNIWLTLYGVLYFRFDQYNSFYNDRCQRRCDLYTSYHSR